VENIFKAAGIRALGHPVQPHMLRKLYAKTLLDNGLPAAATAKMLGHQDSRTTEQWYYELTAEQRREINRRLPVYANYGGLFMESKSQSKLTQPEVLILEDTTLGVRVRVVRTLRGWRQVDLARIADVTQANVSSRGRLRIAFSH